MSQLFDIYRGDSYTLAFVLPSTYDMSRLQTATVTIGQSVYANVIDAPNKTIRVSLKSSETYLLLSKHEIVCTIDDTILGVKNIIPGYLNVVGTRSTVNNTSVNTLDDVTFALTITETTIEVDSVFYNIAKGEKGDKGDDGEKGLS